MEKNKTKESQFSVAHFPQVPCEPFDVPVESLLQARFVCDLLARYDRFLFDNNIKPTFATATVVEEFDEEDQGWQSWRGKKTGGIEKIYKLLEVVVNEG